MLDEHQFFIDPAKSKRKSVTQECRRLVAAAFKVDDTGRQIELSQLSAWVKKFNDVEGNGKACLRTDPTDGQINEFKSLTIVFEASVKTFMS